uniref:Uncharacterized protein n=1 Tax=Oryza punctata TaxID=4537 RepID=A0A0E0LZT2_ORYPU
MRRRPGNESRRSPREGHLPCFRFRFPFPSPWPTQRPRVGGGEEASSVGLFHEANEVYNAHSNVQ